MAESNPLPGNVSPPSSFIDFELTTGKKEIIYLDHFGEPCKYMGYISESDWISPSGSECSDLSSDDSVIWVETTPTVSAKPEISTATPKTKVKFEAKPNSDDERKKERKKKRKIKRRSESPSKRWSGVEYSNSENSEQEVKPKAKQIQSVIKPAKVEPEVEKKPLLGVTVGFGEFRCEVCNITVNSELTLETHMLGKRHRKELKARAIPEVAKKSLALMEGGAAATPPVVVPGKQTRRPLNNKISLIQEIAENYKNGPVPGLSYVSEIRAPDMKDYSYYCKLCDSKCVSNSIMLHLTGFKHYLHCLEKIDNKTYDKYKYCPKKTVEFKIMKILQAHEALHGRGLIMVEEEIASNSSPRYDQPGPSWRDDSREGCVNPLLQDDIDDLSTLIGVQDLDMQFNDFYCTVCDAHMNNKSMWESHVRGKRHLKNKKKCPGENVSKVKSYFDPNATSHLMRDLIDVYQPIVGLEFIKETQGESGDLYNCFLCGACTSNYDIIDHIMSTKHRIKFLEAVHEKGQKNGIGNINAIHDLSTYNKDKLVEDECKVHLEKYGLGKILVYKSKDIYPQIPYRR